MEYDSFLKNINDKLKGASSGDFTDFINNSNDSFSELESAVTSLKVSLQDPNMWNDDVQKTFGNNMESLTESITAGKKFTESVATPVSTKIDPLIDELKNYIEAVNDYNTIETAYNAIDVGSEPVQTEDMTDLQYSNAVDAWKKRKQEKDDKKAELNTQGTKATLKMNSCYTQVNAINSLLGSTEAAAVPAGSVGGLTSNKREETLSDGSLKTVTEWRDADGRLVKEEYEVISKDDKRVEYGTIDYYQNGNKSRWQYTREASDDPNIDKEIGAVVEYDSDETIISKKVKETVYKNGDIYTDIDESYVDGELVSTVIKKIEEQRTGDVYKGITITKGEDGLDTRFIEEIERKVDNSKEYSISEKTVNGVVRERVIEKIVDSVGEETLAIEEHYDAKGNLIGKDIGTMVIGDETHSGIHTTYENGVEKTITERIESESKVEHFVTTGNDEDENYYREMKWVDYKDSGETQNGVREVYADGVDGPVLISRHCDNIYSVDHPERGVQNDVTQEFYENGNVKKQIVGEYIGETVQSKNVINEYEENGTISVTNIDEQTENGVVSRNISIEYDGHNNEKQKWIDSIEYPGGNVENDVVVFYENGVETERVVGTGVSVDDVDDELIIEEFEEPVTPAQGTTVPGIDYKNDPRFQAKPATEQKSETTTSSTQEAAKPATEQKAELKAAAAASAPVASAAAKIEENKQTDARTADLNKKFEEISGMPYTEEGKKSAMISYIDAKYGDSLPKGVTSEGIYNSWLKEGSKQTPATPASTKTETATPAAQESAKPGIDYKNDPRFQAKPATEQKSETTTSAAQEAAKPATEQKAELKAAAAASAPVASAAAKIEEIKQTDARTADLNKKFEEMSGMPYTEEGKKSAMISYIDAKYGDSLPKGVTSEGIYNSWLKEGAKQTPATPAATKTETATPAAQESAKPGIDYKNDPRFQAKPATEQKSETTTSAAQELAKPVTEQKIETPVASATKPVDVTPKAETKPKTEAAPVGLTEKTAIDIKIATQQQTDNRTVELNKEFERISGAPYADEQGRKDAMLGVIESKYGDTLPKGVTSEDIYNSWVNDPNSSAKGLTPAPTTNSGPGLAQGPVITEQKTNSTPVPTPTPPSPVPDTISQPAVEVKTPEPTPTQTPTPAATPVQRVPINEDAVDTLFEQGHMKVTDSSGKEYDAYVNDNFEITLSDGSGEDLLMNSTDFLDGDYFTTK